MARPRKRHVQTSFAYRKLDKNGQHRGGARRNAGRRRTGDFASHAPRPAIDTRHPQHVTLRVVAEVGWLRRLDTYAAVRHALRTVLARHEQFRVVHLSVQNTHVHLIVEAADKRSLADGMRAFQISAAKAINAAYSRRRRLADRRRGRVFADRYFTEDLGSVRQVRNTLSYVLNNWRRHRDDRGAYSLFEGRLDPYASGLAFRGWREAIPEAQRVLPRGYEPPAVSAPRTWLLGTGWTRAPLISMFETPGPRTIQRVDA
ncbi:MAG: transposase [Kofleriaceae bacterium]